MWNDIVGWMALKFRFKTPKRRTDVVMLIEGSLLIVIWCDAMPLMFDQSKEPKMFRATTIGAS